MDVSKKLSSRIPLITNKEGLIMSDLLKHILVGDLIGSLAANVESNQITSLASVFSLGVLSHAIMDMAEPDFTVNWFNPLELKKSSPFLGFQTGGILFVLRNTFKETRGDSHALKLRLAAIMGAVIPDIIDGIYSIINPTAWYSGRLLCPWHINTWQKNPMSMLATAAISSVGLLARYLLPPLFRRLRIHRAPTPL